MNKQEALESIGCKEIVSLNDYLEEIGDVGREWFENFKPDPYFSYDRDKYNDIDEMIREEFEQETAYLSNILNERFEIQAGIDENGKAELLPIVYDNEKNNYLTLYETAELIENDLPQEPEVSVPINQSFSWENGWDYDEAELTVRVSDFDVSETLNRIYADVKEETSQLLNKQITDKDVKTKTDKTKQEVER